MAKIVFLLLIGGMFASPARAANAAAILDIINAASNSLTAGTSLASTSLGGMLNSGYLITCVVSVDNWTKYPLKYSKIRIEQGAVTKPARPVLPSQVEAFSTRKVSDAASGTSGTASWIIEGLNRRVYVMWSIPFDYNHHTNWLAVGLSTAGFTEHPEDLFNQMYYGRSGTNISFVKRQYVWDAENVVYSDGVVEVQGNMGTGHKSTVNLTVRPKSRESLATPIKTLLYDNHCDK